MMCAYGFVLAATERSVGKCWKPLADGLQADASIRRYNDEYDDPRRPPEHRGYNRDQHRDERSGPRYVKAAFGYQKLFMRSPKLMQA